MRRALARRSTVARALAALLATTGCVAPPDDAVDDAADDAIDEDAGENTGSAASAATSEIVIQAETAALTAPMRRGRDERAFIETSVTDYDSEAAGAAVLAFNAPVTADYELLVTGKASGPLNNSILLQVDSGATAVLQLGEEYAPEFPYNQYRDHSVTTVRLNAGAHQITIRGRERFAHIDQVRLRFTRPDAPLANLRMRTFADGKGVGWSTAVAPKAALYKMYYDGPYSAVSIPVEAAKIKRFVDAVHAINPQTQVGMYMIDYELQDPGQAQGGFAGFLQASQKVSQENWWLRTTAGARVQWTTRYNAFNIALTCGARQTADGNGESAPAALARIWASLLGPAGLDFFFKDNSKLQNQGDELRGNVNYLCDGVGRSSRDPAVVTAFHQGERAFLDAMSARLPALYGVGNFGTGDDMLTDATIAKRWDGGNMEGYMGIWWSADSMSGWTTTFERLRTMRNNLRNHRYLSGLLTLETPVYPMIRYGLATILLLDDALFALNIGDEKFFQPDEYLARLGDAVDPEPTGPRQNGIWFRRYQGGAVIVNPNDNKGRPLARTTLTRRNNAVTLSGWTNHNLTPGTPIKIVDNYNATSFNGTFTITSVTPNSITWAQAGADQTSANGFGRIAVRSTIDLRGLGLRHLGASDPRAGAAVQDPSVNNGAPLGIEQVWSSDGFVAVNQ